ncbi:hypothetical protein O181_059522 [Austropuccinia psidii MF-1]|uniref:Retrotransposon gag domain-containing protein n=1 Tax=Austropuccinia psidii MF-1 TaxID=1389203 RepID=A0A9Q3HXI1_9BASI|nr:hypothetical protein [Austropuccinia psidii MF-1]
MSEGARARPGEVEDEEGEESVEEEDSREPEGEDALENAPEVPQGFNLAPTNQPLVSQSDPSLLKIMEKIDTIIGHTSQEAAPRENSKAPAFKNLSIKALYSFDGTQAHKLRGFIHSCQFIFHNDPANFFPERKKVLYSTFFLTHRAGKWIEPYLSNISNEDPSYLLNNWQLFQTQLFTLFGDPNEVRKAEQQLDNLRMKESGHLGSYPGSFDTLQELREITLELDTRYHERQKEKGSHQEKTPPVTGSNPSRPPQDSSSKRPHRKKNNKGKQFQALKDKTHSSLLNKDNKSLGSEKERRIKEWLCTYCGGTNPIEI